MKVIVTSQALTPWHGGSSISEASLCAHLSEYCEVTVLCRRGALDYAFAKSFGLNHVREYRPEDVFEAWRRKDNWLYHCLKSADILHLNGHWKWENYFFARLCQSQNLPYLLHPRGMLLVGHRRVMLKKAFNSLIGDFVVRNASRVIALSKFEVGQLAPYPVAVNRIEVIPNGISSKKSKRAVVPIGSVAEGERFFLYLGRLESRKNLLFLVDVFANYAAAGGTANLLFVGPSERGYDRQIATRIAKHKLEKRVRLHPPVYDPEKSALLQLALAVIYPTIDEPFGRVPFETLAAGGVPIIPDASGSAEYLQSFLPQCVYRHQDASSLQKTMNDIENRTDKTLDNKLKAARAFVETELDWDHISAKIYRLYESIIGTPSGTKTG